MTDGRLDFRDGGSFEFNALLERVEIKSSKGGSYASGTLSTSDGSIEFKKWRTPELDDGVYHVRGKYQTYNGQNSVIIDRADPLPDTVDKDAYRYSPYDGGLNEDSHRFVRTLSPKAQELFKILLKGDGGGDPLSGDLSERFKDEYAAIWHHDAYPHGLMAHSLKVGRFAKLVVEDPMYSALYALSQDEKDLIVVGAFLHDLGKTLEYDGGKISHLGRMLSHRTIMSERLSRLRPRVSGLYGEDGYWILQSIFTQHHGRWEETPRTIEAYVVHLVDTIDSQLTDLNELMKNPDADSQIRMKDPAPSLILLTPRPSEEDDDWDSSSPDHAPRDGHGDRKDNGGGSQGTIFDFDPAANSSPVEGSDDSSIDEFTGKSEDDDDDIF
jgi:3'-5' exoribonuclease